MQWDAVHVYHEFDYKLHK